MGVLLAASIVKGVLASALGYTGYIFAVRQHPRCSHDTHVLIGWLVFIAALGILSP